MISKHPTLLLTRPKGAAQDFVKRLNLKRDEGVVFSPLIEIQYLKQGLTFEGAIFSSRNGVISAGLGRGRPAYCVGEVTAKCARDSDFVVKVVAETADELIEKTVSNPPEFRLLHLRGEFARGEIAKNLTAADVLCSEQITYLQNAVPLSKEALALIRENQRIIVPLFSPRSADLFCQQLLSHNIPISKTRKMKFVALSQSVADQLPLSFQENTIVPLRPNSDMMLQLVARFFCD